MLTYIPAFMQGTSASQFNHSNINTHVHTKRQLSISNSPVAHNSGLWEETGAPGRSPHRLRDNMQTQHRKDRKDFLYLFFIKVTISTIYSFQHDFKRRSLNGQK